MRDKIPLKRISGYDLKTRMIYRQEFDNIGGWMGLEESPHCPFDVMEACRTSVRRDSHQSGADERWAGRAARDRWWLRVLAER